MTVNDPNAIQATHSIPWAVLAPLLVMGSGLIGVYANMTASDREFSAQILQIRDDMLRVERESKDRRGDIRNDLNEIKSELRELRGQLAFIIHTPAPTKSR